MEPSSTIILRAVCQQEKWSSDGRVSGAAELLAKRIEAGLVMESCLSPQEKHKD